ncbi:MAG TPA: choice-of-anchor tandem repeat GloVer-containing protein [Candidatus Nitrosotalea sp.]|nr:choice-of-anchor tandem repeat GloVer-containing protein [Candidatus Nitrosotalea sp.]
MLGRTVARARVRRIVFGVGITRPFLILLCVLALVSCSRGYSVIPGDVPATDAATSPATAAYKQLFAFPGTPSGSAPTGMLYVKGSLFGTTTGGGAKTFGSVFVRGLSGKVHVLYSFQGGSDGAGPEGTLTELNGSFYGTTQYGGADGDGTVFSVTPAGKERVVYSFKGGTDGATPVLDGLVAINGKLYGTTNAGGLNSCTHQAIVGCGIVFSLTTSGHESVLYRFKGKPDGACPSGSLIASGSALYGTTNFGGKYDNGSAFKITTGGSESVIYSFKGFPDGVMPFGGLTQLGGTFYGTTTLGGAYQGAGTVFALTPSGTESVLHSFTGAPDGALPYAGLIAVGSTLYGTTELGGSSQSACIGHGIIGCGTIFSITTTGTLTQLYRFRGRKDGAYPLAGLVASPKNLIYGSTLAGGNSQNGTIFEIAQ